MADRRKRSFDWFFRPSGADEDAPLSAEAEFSAVLADLPAVERSALALAEIGGLETEEIAARLGTDVHVAKVVLERARVAARTKLRDRRAGIAALLPWQWLLPSASPAARAAGVVAAAGRRHGRRRHRHRPGRRRREADARRSGRAA